VLLERATGVTPALAMTGGPGDQEKEEFKLTDRRITHPRLKYARVASHRVPDVATRITAAH